MALVIIKHVENGSAFPFMLDRLLANGPAAVLMALRSDGHAGCGFAGVV